MYLEEFGISQKITREFGWAKNGKQIVERISGKRERKINGIAACRRGKIISPLIYEGTMNTEFFNQVETCLLPELQHGEVVILDNASFHKSPKVKTLLEEKGCFLLFLPPYSPQLNPIEHFWA